MFLEITIHLFYIDFFYKILPEIYNPVIKINCKFLGIDYYFNILKVLKTQNYLCFQKFLRISGNSNFWTDSKGYNIFWEFGLTRWVRSLPLDSQEFLRSRAWTEWSRVLLGTLNVLDVQSQFSFPLRACWGRVPH